jgi:hypothetical protein
MQVCLSDSVFSLSYIHAFPRQIFYFLLLLSLNPFVLSFSVSFSKTGFKYILDFLLVFFTYNYLCGLFVSILYLLLHKRPAVIFLHGHLSTIVSNSRVKNRNIYISLTMPNCRYFKTLGDSLKKVSHEKNQESKVVSVDRTPFKGGRATVILFKDLPMCYDTFRRQYWGMALLYIIRRQSACLF